MGVKRQTGIEKAFPHDQAAHSDGCGWFERGQFPIKYLNALPISCQISQARSMKGQPFAGEKTGMKEMRHPMLQIGTIPNLLLSNRAFQSIRKCKSAGGKETVMHLQYL